MAKASKKTTKLLANLLEELELKPTQVQGLLESMQINIEDMQHQVDLRKAELEHQEEMSGNLGLRTLKVKERFTGLQENIKPNPKDVPHGTKLNIYFKEKKTMDIIKIKLNQRLHQMVEEVVEEYQLSPNEIILNTLNHFIKDKKDFFGG